MKQWCAARQGRGFEMVLRLGLYFGGLAVDYVTGQADSVDRVQYRAAQLRRASIRLLHSYR